MGNLDIYIYVGVILAYFIMADSMTMTIAIRVVVLMV